MMPNIVRGGDAPGLVRYLFGAGRANEHKDQHIVASSKIMAEFGWSAGAYVEDKEMATWCGADLEEAVRVHNKHVMRQKKVFDPQTNTWNKLPYKTHAHVWHCSLSLHPDEPGLTDEKWQAIAHDFMKEMGFDAPDQEECRWIAVRHGYSKNGGDHIHIAASVVREDGSLWKDSFDFPRSQKACTKLEKAYGLEVLASRELESTSKGDSPQDMSEALDDFRDEHGHEFEYPVEAVPGREEAVTTQTPLTRRARLEVRMRCAAAAARTEKEYVTELRAQGVRVRPRYAKGAMSEVVGYSVALEAKDGQETQWHAASKVAKDLSIVQLRKNVFEDSAIERDEALDVWKGRAAYAVSLHKDEDKKVIDDVTQSLIDAAEKTRHDLTNAGNYREFADTCRDVSAQFALAAHIMGKEGWQMAQAARMFGRLAQNTHYTTSRPRTVLPKPSRLTGANGTALVKSVSSVSALGGLVASALVSYGYGVEAARIKRESEAAIESMRQYSAQLQSETAQIEKDMQEKRDFIERRMAAYEERINKGDSELATALDILKDINFGPSSGETNTQEPSEHIARPAPTIQPPQPDIGMGR
ncbi:MAG: relaxase/mobilization nuclease domain-containing protein [Actinomycetaceae bacterium]|nr:relaxase/mobilization nuclease domain-containing protein [Actinomycetaceae bacterium]